MNTKLYIAYGSNMDEAQMSLRCPGSEMVAKGMLEGYQLLFKGSQTGAYATIEKPNAATKELPVGVPVLVWEITPHDEKMLDRYEGFPRFYYKTKLTVTHLTWLRKLRDRDPNEADVDKWCLFGKDSRKKSEQVQGMVYIMPEDHILNLPFVEYYMMLHRAYERFGFDLKVLNSGVRYSVDAELKRNEKEDYNG